MTSSSTEEIAIPFPSTWDAKAAIWTSNGTVLQSLLHQFYYLLISPPVDLDSDHVYDFRLSLEFVGHGAISFGLQDAGGERWLQQAHCSGSGAATCSVRIWAREPATCRLVLANYRPDGPAITRLKNMHLDIGRHLIRNADDLGHDAPDAVAAVEHTTDDTIALLPRADLTELARNNRGLLHFDFHGYLHASRRRILALIRMLRRLGCTEGKVLDQGALFGNFSLALHKLGYEVVASDYYSHMGGVLQPWCGLLSANGVAVVDAGDHEAPLPFVDEQFDVVLSMGVIEHIPHSPRRHLLELLRCLRPGGLLIVETPNLAYRHKRDLLAQGRSVFFPIDVQFDSEPPFTGHHREYVIEEVEWMLTRLGLIVETTHCFDYTGASADVAARREPGARPSPPDQRELILCAGRKPCRSDR